MAETLSRVEVVIAIKETELIGEYENHQGIPLITIPFWMGRILLAREIQENLQTMWGILEELASSEAASMNQPQDSKCWIQFPVNCKVDLENTLLRILHLQ